MNSLINDIKTWHDYHQTFKDIWHGDLRGDSEKIPQEIRVLFNRPTILTPSDLSHQLITELYLQSAKTIEPCFKIDSDNNKIIETLVYYVRRDERFLKLETGYSFAKGLMLRGPVGCGKTTLFRALVLLTNQLRFYTWNDYFFNYPQIEAIRLISSNLISEMFCLDGFEAFSLNQTNRKATPVDLININLIIDDIGSEPIANHYGQSLNVISELIIRRYAKKSMTYATSNMDTKALKEFYGLRTFDRMREMFNDIVLPGESRRH